MYNLLVGGGLIALTITMVGQILVAFFKKGKIRKVIDSLFITETKSNKSILFELKKSCEDRIKD